MRADQAVQDFERAAREFCDWVVASPVDAHSEAHTLLRLLAALYHAGIRLPHEPPIADEEAPEREPQPDAAIMQRRAEGLPFQYYGATLHPTDPEKLFDTGTGDLCDDVADIWSDLTTGLLHWDAGEVIDAVWEWQFEFENHWGEHAADAIRALHEWFVDDSERWNPPSA